MAFSDLFSRRRKDEPVADTGAATAPVHSTKVLAKFIAGLTGRSSPVLLDLGTVTGSNVTAVVDDLERRGLVARQNADADRRAIVIKLTPKGRNVFAEMAPAHAEWILELFGEMPASEKRNLVRQLDGLKAAMRATLSTSL